MNVGFNWKTLSQSISTECLRKTPDVSLEPTHANMYTYVPHTYPYTCRDECIHICIPYTSTPEKKVLLFIFMDGEMIVQGGISKAQ